MGLFAFLAIIGFIVMHMVYGTLGLFLLQCAGALVAYSVIASGLLRGRSSATRATVSGLQEDLELLQACKRRKMDADTCMAIGPDEGRIRAALAGIQDEAATKELQAWLKDDALREVYRNTGKLLTPRGVRKEILDREARIAALKSDYTERGGFDLLAASIVGLLILLVPVAGFAGAAGYGVLQLVTRYTD